MSTVSDDEHALAEMNSALSRAEDAYWRARRLVFDRLPPEQVHDAALDVSQREALEALDEAEAWVRQLRSRRHAMMLREVPGGC